MLESLAISIFAPAINKLPFLDLSMVFQQEGVQTFIDYLCFVMYMLPWNTAFSIMGIIIALHFFRVVVAFFKSLWGVLPLV